MLKRLAGALLPALFCVTSIASAGTHSIDTLAPSSHINDIASARSTIAKPPTPTTPSHSANSAMSSSSVAAAPVAVLGVRVPAPGLAPFRAHPSRNYSEPSTPRPGYLAPMIDSTFGTRITRVAGDAGTSIGGGVSGTWGADARHHYSKDQPWNADGSLLALQNNGGGIVLLDGETYQPRKGRCTNFSVGDDRWHPSMAHRNERISVRGTDLFWYDAVQCVKTRTWTLPFAVDFFGPSEGNTSLDGRFAAFTDGRRMFVVDMDPQAPLAAYPNSRIGPAVNIDDCGLAGGCVVDWVSVSPSGKYVVVNYDGDIPRVFDVNPETLALTARALPSGSPRCHGTAAQGFIYDLGHADMTLNPFDGDEDVIIGQESCGNSGRRVNGVVMSSVVMVRLRDGVATPLTNPSNEAQAHHISTRNYDRPGWVYIGYHVAPGETFNDEIVAVKLDGSATAERFAHKHSNYSSCYRCESHSVPSRDGRRVLWASNWTTQCTTCGTGNDVKPYVVDARAEARPGLTPVAPHAILADASRSTDSDGRIASYTFDFGDGKKAGPQLSPFAPHIYPAGRWNLKLTVTDDSGATTTATQLIEVASVGSNQPPLAVLTMTPSSGVAPLNVVADASASSDPEGALASYRFDFGDGTVISGVTPALPHVYAVGTWNATLTVTDSLGAQSVASARVTVDAPPPPDSLTLNLVGNPSFESNLDGWKAYNGATIQRVRGGTTGAWCLAVQAPLVGSVFGVNDSPNWISKVPAAGTRYRIAAFVRALGLMGAVRIQIREWNRGTQQGKTVYSAPVRLGLMWQELSVEITAAKQGSTIDVQVIEEPVLGRENFYIDDVSIRILAPRSEAELGSRPATELAVLDLPPRVSPNPMFGRGTVELRTALPGPLRIALYDAAGREVRVLCDQQFAPAGTHRLEIDGRSAAGAALPAGVYFYQVQSSAGRANGRFVMSR